VSTTASATQRAYDHVRKQLANGELEPGARLVTRSLAQELGISLNPVREALTRLASERLVEHVPGAGTFVRRLDAQEIRDLYGLREAIECHAVAEAVRHISPVELDELDALCAQWRELAERMRGQGLSRLPREEISVAAALQVDSGPTDFSARWLPARYW
jgi:DNA-binding GntR family transcriptional regulator